MKIGAAYRRFKRNGRKHFATSFLTTDERWKQMLDSEQSCCGFRRFLSNI
ncbi:hypothetical protein PO124_15950 [Bacillus licheniformis]|nr:hypothetical protein [Bacillus licheniformis]